MPSGDADNLQVEEGQNRRTAGWAPMARDLTTVAGILDDLPYPAHLHAVDADRTYPWVAANTAALDALGLTRDEVIGRPLAHVITDRAAAAVMRRRRDEVVDRLQPIKVELAVELATGRRRFDTTLVPIRDADGGCAHVFAVWNDATALRESETRLRTAAEAGDKGFAILESVRDDDGRIADFRFMWANRNSERWLGADGRALAGRTLSEIAPIPEMPDAIGSYAEVVRTGEMLEIEFRDRLPHRRGRWMHQQIARVGDGIAITANDITERKTAEAALELRIETERLIAEISRDLNATPAEALDHALVATLERLASFVEAGAAGLLQYSADGACTTRTHEWPPPGSIARLPAALPASPYLAGLAETDLLLVRTLDELPAEHDDYRRPLESLGVQSMAFLPVRGKGHLIGLITLVWGNERAEVFEPVLSGLVVVGDVIAAALERCESEQALRARTEAEALLTDISRTLLPLAVDEVDDAVVDALGRVARFLGADAATLARLEPYGELVRELNWSDSGRSGLPEVIPAEQLPWLLPALAQMETVFVPDLAVLPAAAGTERELLGAIGVRALAAFPLRLSDQLAGLVGFAWRSGTPGPVAAKLEGLHVLGDVLVAALERKLAEQALHQSEERFRALVQHTSDVISILDAEGRIVYQSPAAQRLFGWRMGDLEGTDAFDLVHPDDRARVAERFFAGLAEQRNETVEFRLCGKDGRWYDVETIGNNLLDDPAVRGVVLTTRDITERKQSEQAVRDREARFRALVQNTSDIITVMDADGLLTYVSPAATRILGWEFAGPERFDPLELVHPDDRARVAEAYAAGVDGRPVEYRMRHADGSWRFLESVGTNLLDDPAVQGVVVNSRDITERKQVEAERARHGGAEHLISEISRRLLTATADDIDRLLDDALADAARFLGAAAGALQHYSQDGEFTIRSHLWTTQELEALRHFPERRSTRRWFLDALQDVDHLLITEGEFDTWFEENSGALAEAGLRAVAFLPVRTGGRLSGFLAFSWLDPVAAEAEAVLPTLRVLADVFIAALERTRTEARQRESEARYRGVVEATPDLIFRIRRDGTYLDVHGNPDRMLTPPEETIGRTVHEVRPADYAGVLTRNIEEALDTGTLQTFEHDMEVGGEMRSYEIRIVPVARDEVLDIVRDVTDRMEAQLALRRSDERFRALVQHSTDMITVLDADGTVMYTSPASEEILGWNAHEREGLPGDDLVHPEDQERIATMFSDALARPGPTETVRVRLRHRDGSWRTIEAVGTNLFTDPAVRGFVVNGRDVTERLRLEEQLLQSQKMEAVGQLAGGVAHDFNNLLTAISGYVALLLADVATDDPMHEDLIEIDRAATRAAALVDQLLAFSRRKLVQPTVIDLNEVVETMRTLMGRLLTADIELETALAPALPGIRADRSQVEQVIMNLVVNARDAMPDGGPLLIETSVLDVDAQDAASRLDVTPNRYVCLSVSDHGVGMDPAVQARVFEPFFSTKEVGQGTGLGLSTVYGIVSQASGHVRVYSEPGIGTTFRVLLPAVASELDAGPTDNGRVGASSGRGHETILVVEDEAAVRSLAAEVLRRAGYEVLVAGDGPDAVAIADAHEGPIDLLLTDVVLPGMRGVAVAEKLRSGRPDLRVLYMSGYTEGSIVKGGELTRDIEFLAKPFRTDELAHRVREVLDDAQLARP